MTGERFLAHANLQARAWPRTTLGAFELPDGLAPLLIRTDYGLTETPFFADSGRSNTLSKTH